MPASPICVLAKSNSSIAGSFSSPARPASVTRVSSRPSDFSFGSPQQLLQAGIGDRLLRKLYRPQVRQGRNTPQIRVGQPGAGRIDGDRLAMLAEFHADALLPQRFDFRSRIAGWPQPAPCTPRQSEMT